MWNHTIAPSVSAAVIKGSGSEHLSGGQQKVANTALYVLMQRAIVSGCPLSGQGMYSVKIFGIRNTLNSDCFLPNYWLILTLITFYLTEKERYLAGFNGSNELDIKMRPKGESMSSPLTPTGDNNPLEALISGQNKLVKFTENKPFKIQ